MNKTVESVCSCGEPVVVELGRQDVCRTDGKRPFQGGDGYSTTRFRCKKCAVWLADTCPAAAFE